MGKRIDDTVCHCLRMRRSAENVVRFYDKMLAPYGVTARQYSLLNALRQRNGCSIRELADATQLDRSTLSRSLKPLIRLGYISDRKEIGARDSVLALTKEGRSTCKQAAERWALAQRHFEDILRKEQLTALENALEALQDL